MSDIYDKLLPYYEQHKDVIKPTCTFGLQNGPGHKFVVGPDGGVCILGGVLLGQDSDYSGDLFQQAADILGIARAQANDIARGFDGHALDCLREDQGDAYEAGAAICRLAQERASE